MKRFGLPFLLAALVAGSLLAGCAGEDKGTTTDQEAAKNAAKPRDPAAVPQGAKKGMAPPPI